MIEDGAGVRNGDVVARATMVSLRPGTLEGWGTAVTVKYTACSSTSYRLGVVGMEVGRGGGTMIGLGSSAPGSGVTVGG